jgi:hypothetical protein
VKRITKKEKRCKKTVTERNSDGGGEVKGTCGLWAIIYGTHLHGLRS